MGKLKAFGLFLEDVIWPRRLNCLGCGDPRRAQPDTGLCPACLEALEAARIGGNACPRCLCALVPHKKCAFCRKGVLKRFDGCYAPFYYQPVTRALIHSLKFGGSEDALPLLTGAMADSLADGDWDLMVPVPLHPARKRERGFNQAARLAEGAGAITGICCDNDALKRLKNTRQQSRLQADLRRGNVAGVFAADAGRVAGRKVLLVDDVRTTGYTAAACGEALLEAGALKIGLLTACAVARPEKET